MNTNSQQDDPSSLAEAREMIDGLRSRLEQEQRACERSQYNERCFRELAEHIREVFWMTNPLGDMLVYISPAYEQIWGQTCQSLYEDPGRRLAWVHDADRERVLKAFKRDGPSGDFDEIYRIDRPDGEVRWIRDRAFPVYDDDGEIYRLAGFALDISDGIRDNDRISEMNTTIGMRDRMSVFAALGTGLAHDISQPLTAARNFIANARHTAADMGTASEAALGKADHEIERAVEVVRHLRDFAREGRPTLSQEPLEPLLHDIHQLMDPALRAVGIRYRGPTVETLSNIELPLDRIFAQQVLRNLISNAIDSYEDDDADNVEGDRYVGVDVRTDERYIEIEVSDNGRGIDKKVNPFEPFVTTKDDGLGLGLAVSRSLARSHRGDLILASRGRHGQGSDGDERTRFVLRLPRESAEQR